jgi:hypothetical protein
VNAKKESLRERGRRKINVFDAFDAFDAFKAKHNPTRER